MLLGGKWRASIKTGVAEVLSCQDCSGSSSAVCCALLRKRIRASYYLIAQLATFGAAIGSGRPCCRAWGILVRHLASRPCAYPQCCHTLCATRVHKSSGAGTRPCLLQVNPCKSVLRSACARGMCTAFQGLPAVSCCLRECAERMLRSLALAFLLVAWTFA